MADDDLAKRRFFLLMGARFSGLLLFFAGLAIVYSDVLRVGGWPQLGAVLVILGVLESVLAPLILTRRWNRQ